MIEHTYQVLGYFQLLEILSNYASCQLGRTDCLSLRPSDSREVVEGELTLVAEMRLLLKVGKSLSFSDVHAIVPHLKRSSVQESHLEPQDFLSIQRVVEGTKQARKVIRSQKQLCPHLYHLAEEMPVCEALLGAIKKAISPSGAVKDSASPSLRKIRTKKTRLRSNLHKRLEGILKSALVSDKEREDWVTIREGRYVIPIRTDQKSKINGIVHDYSQTKATCFLEPLAAIEDNNRLAELDFEEEIETIRILKALTALVKERTADLEFCEALIGRLDGLRARAMFGEALSCVRPEIGEQSDIALKKARNPILDALATNSGESGESQDPPIPVDILLDAEQNILIISGPNRGGKTVTLKTLGLTCLMAHAGMHIPAEEGSSLPLFERILADIGDDQDLWTGMSTFSAHVAHLKYIAAQAGENVLIIIDEPGMGTDPDEGVALAMAILDFISHKGAFVAVSTHSNRLKTYALMNGRARNASVQFDPVENRPTFKLDYGFSGGSHALEIADDMGMPQMIINGAKRYIDKGEAQLNQLIDKLNRLMIDAARKRGETEEEKRKYQKAVADLEEKGAVLEIEQRAFLEEKREEAESVLAEARKELNRAIDRLKSGKHQSQAQVCGRFREIDRQLTGLFSDDSEVDAPVGYHDIKEGQQVHHKKLNQEGLIMSVDTSAGTAMVMLGKIRVCADVHDLEVLKKSRKRDCEDTPRPVAWSLGGSHPIELNIVGYRVPDAIDLLDRAIDRALVEGGLTLKIVHGFGTGRLREAVREHLREIPSVKTLAGADPRFGGEAVTVVELQ